MPDWSDKFAGKGRIVVGVNCDAFPVQSSSVRLV
jgi:hypothetical protein